MGAMASQITSLTIVHSTVYSGADQRKHQSSASMAFVRGIHRWPVNSPHKWSVTRKMFPFDDVIMDKQFHPTLCILYNYSMPVKGNTGVKVDLLMADDVPARNRHMSVITSTIIGNSIICSTVPSSWQQGKRQRFALLGLCQIWTWSKYSTGNFAKPKMLLKQKLTNGVSVNPYGTNGTVSPYS